MHPYSGGSKLASVRSEHIRSTERGAEQKVRGNASRRGETRELTIKDCDALDLPTSVLKKKQVLRVSAFGVGLVYGSWKLSSLKSTAAKAAAEKEKAASRGGGH